MWNWHYFNLKWSYFTLLMTQMIHGAGVFTYICRKQHLNVGKYPSPMDPSWVSGDGAYFVRVSKNFSTYPWKIPQTLHPQFMKEFLSFGSLGLPDFPEVLGINRFGISRMRTSALMSPGEVSVKCPETESRIFLWDGRETWIIPFSNYWVVVSMFFFIFIHLFFPFTWRIVPSDLDTWLGSPPFI